MRQSKHFTLKELVPREVYEQYGKEAWKLFDEKLISTIDFLREAFNVPIIINGWQWNGQNQYRGYRPENCKIGAENSAHKGGMAVDMTIEGITANEARKWLKENQSKLPHDIRCEDGVDWLRIDTRAKNGYKL